MNARVTETRRASSALVFMVAALATASCDKSGPGAATAAQDHPMVGVPAPDFDLESQSGGGRASVAGARGKVVIVDFWATWCEPCRASFPKYQAMVDKFGSDLVVIGVSEDDEPDGITDFASETGAKFPLVWDSDKGIAGAYGPESMPTSYVVDRQGLVRYVHEGFHDGDEAQIEAQVQSLIE